MSVAVDSLQSAEPALRRKRVLSSVRSWPVNLKVGVAIVAVIMLAGLLAPLLTPYSPIVGNFRETLLAPSWAHPFGTDNLGRDVLTRVLYGTRVDLQIALITTYVPLTYGLMLGAMAGFLGGWFDRILMRFVDIAIAFPFLVLIIVIVAILGPGIRSMYIAVFVVGWTMYCRLARADMLVIREQEYLLAARALGFGSWRIVLRHALPSFLAQLLGDGCSTANSGMGRDRGRRARLPAPGLVDLDVARDLHHHDRPGIQPHWGRPVKDTGAEICPHSMSSVGRAPVVSKAVTKCDLTQASQRCALEGRTCE
jgi:ABC-type dipeptide/oligopeptide/nickel transport system permease subunit